MTKSKTTNQGLPKGKIILDLCGGTGAWSKPYKDAGYEVIVITLPQFDITAPDVLNYCVNLQPYGILAAPPCQMFSIARTNAKTPRDFKKGMKVVSACLDIIRECALQKKLAFWALENPRGYLRHFIGLPAYTFSPHEFGDLYVKRTDLWGFFNLPKKTPIELDEQQLYELRHHTRIPAKLPEGYKPADGESIRSARRAITPSGFAKAFMKANP